MKYKYLAWPFPPRRHALFSLFFLNIVHCCSCCSVAVTNSNNQVTFCDCGTVLLSTRAENWALVSWNFSLRFLSLYSTSWKWSPLFNCLVRVWLLLREIIPLANFRIYDSVWQVPGTCHICLFCRLCHTYFVLELYFLFYLINEKTYSRF